MKQNRFSTFVYDPRLLSVFVSWSDYRELGEKQIKGSGAVHPRPPHEHPGHCGGGHCHPARS